VRLSDLEDLPRPGYGDYGEDGWQLFINDCRITRLDWPDAVVEQFLFDHGRNSEFLIEYGHIELQDLAWELIGVAAEDFMTVTVCAEFRDWVDSCERHFQFRIDQRVSEERDSWREDGTWIVPPVLVDGSLVTPRSSTLRLIEGHTRLGILRGLLAAGIADPSHTHQAWVGRSR
jgi:hypothetical protein